MTHIILFLLVINIFCGYWNMQRPCLKVVIINRWCRWILFSLVMAYFVDGFEWTDKSFWQLFCLAFIGWFLIETAYHWLAIRAFSYSQLPLFPKYLKNHVGDEWPNTPYFIELRNQLRNKEFSHTASFVLSFGIASIKVAVFEDATRKTQLQVFFMPRRMGGIMASFSFCSISSKNVRYVTDNLHLPFGGFYPENLMILRKPLIDSFEKLYAMHKKQIQKAVKNLITWEETDILTDLNQQQRQLEQLNIRKGFILASHLHDTQGQLSKEGRYRLCKEIWKLRYLGRC